MPTDPATPTAPAPNPLTQTPPPWQALQALLAGGPPSADACAAEDAIANQLSQDAAYQRECERAS